MHIPVGGELPLGESDAVRVGLGSTVAVGDGLADMVGERPRVVVPEAVLLAVKGALRVKVRDSVTVALVLRGQAVAPSKEAYFFRRGEEGQHSPPRVATILGHMFWQRSEPFRSQKDSRNISLG